jgi:hypothetical protein
VIALKLVVPVCAPNFRPFSSATVLAEAALLPLTVTTDWVTS